MSFKIRWGYLFFAIIFVWLMGGVLDLVFTKSQKNPWVTTAGYSVVAQCAVFEDTNIVECVCSATKEDNVMQTTVVIQDSILAGFAREKEIKHLCEESCQKICFAEFQRVETEMLIIKK